MSGVQQMLASRPMVGTAGGGGAPGLPGTSNQTFQPPPLPSVQPHQMAPAGAVSAGGKGGGAMPYVQAGLQMAAIAAVAS